MSLTTLHNLNYYGKGGVSLVEPGTLVTDKFGVSSCTAVFRMRAHEWHLAPKINTPHPIWTGLKIHRTELTIKGPWAYCQCEYNGGTSDWKNKDDLGEPIYELSIGMSEDPIETHPNFIKIAGTPTNPRNGSRWEDKDGNIYDANNKPKSNDGLVFHSFSTIVNGGKNPKAKVTTYLNASKIVFRKIWASKTKPDITRAGTIGTPPHAPTLPKGGQWMNMGITSAKEGSIYKNTEEWMASGPRGWDRDIYG